MRRVRSGLALLLALAAFGAPAVRADDHKHGPVKIIAHLHGDDGKEREVKFDLSKPAEKKEFLEALEHGHVHEMKADLPPEIIPKRFDTGIWSVVIFVSLFLLLRAFAWKPLLSGLQKREEKVRGALEQAESTRREAMELQSRLDAKMRDAGGEIARMMEEARRDAVAVREQMVAEAREEIQKERDRLLREVNLAKDQALSEIWQQSVTLATSISAKAVKRGLSEEDHRRLLDESLADLKQAGAGFGRRG